MSHVTRAQVQAFVASGWSTPEFEAHVDGCDACAALLARGAQRALAVGAPPAELAWRVPLLVAATAAFAVFLALLPKAPPLPVRSSPAPVIAAPARPLAGVADAGVPEHPMPPTAVASLDAGDLMYR